MAKLLLSGNESVARGAYEYGVTFAAAYPGTPSTEILENIAQYDEIMAQWSPNEKVSLEVAMGASFGGARSLVAMKHVGLNVAADPLFTSPFAGVNGGFVIVSADDPGMHSSQNEQDNRNYAKFAKIPLLEPSDSQECKDFVGFSLDISEKFDTPVLLRLSTRICHSKGVVELKERTTIPRRPYRKDIKRRVVLPAHARKRHYDIERRLIELSHFGENIPINHVEEGDRNIGIITSGIAYQYAKEILPNASFLKLGLSHPLPRELIRKFASRVKALYVIEELDPFLEEQIRAMGIPVIGKEKFPLCGELNPLIVRRAMSNDESVGEQSDVSPMPSRPPVLCPGCGHRGFFYVANKLKLTVCSDIGCYTLGTLPPLSAIDTCICMGASVGNALGVEKATGNAVIAAIGDSTFIHSGIAGLIDVVYNQGMTTVCILDNSTTAMTGHQEHPGTGRTLKGQKTTALDYVALVKGIGVKDVRVVDPYSLVETEEALRQAIELKEPSVIIVRHPCALKAKEREGRVFSIDAEKCVDCGLCLRLGCPAIFRENEKLVIDPVLCAPNCSMCQQVCQVGAIG